VFKQFRLKLSPALSLKEQRINHSWAYPLYAALIEKIDGALAELLHEQGQGLVSQYLDFSAGESVWYITVFGAARSAVTEAVQELYEISLSKYESALRIGAKEVCAEFSEREFCEKYMLLEKPSGRITLYFNSPTSFKSAGRYAIFPTKELILQSCVHKWNALAEVYKLEDAAALEHILEHCDIVRYKLRSAVFDLKGVFLPAFMGYATFSVRGPEPLLRLFNLIAAFSRYSGIGIKTALGMGGCVPVFYMKKSEGEK
jgi:CRISPR-associated endoribonuclease Cas6